MRVSFSIRMFDRLEDAVENGPIEGVDRTVLNRLVLSEVAGRLAWAPEAKRNAEDTERECDGTVRRVVRIQWAAPDGGRKVEQELWAQLNELFKKERANEYI